MAKVYKQINPNRLRRRGMRAGAAVCALAAAACVACACVFRREIFLLLCLTAALGFLAWKLAGRAAVLQSGLAGEEAAAKALAGLPASYTVLCNVPVQVGGRRTELDAVAVGPGGVFIVEVKNHAGSIIGEADAPQWRQTRAGKGGRPINKMMANPLVQNRRQVELTRRLLEGEGVRCPVTGCVYFANSYITVHVRGAASVFTSAREMCRAIEKTPRAVSPAEAQRAVRALSGGRI